MIKIAMSWATAMLALLALPAVAANNCTFSDSGSGWTLMGDCDTDATIVIPDGYTLDGNGFTITAVDPSGDHFRGAVVSAFGGTAHVTDLTVTSRELVNACDGGADRLRGIMFDGASGTIQGNTVLNINQGPSGCQEGNGIEVRNCDGAAQVTVDISHNIVNSWQKTGIVANCDVDANITHNQIGASATQATLAANSLQVGYGAKANVQNNHVAGNSWAGPSVYAATAMLIYDPAEGTVVRHNNLMDGNADVGIYIFSDGGVTADNNRVFETGDDGLFDIGIGNWGSGADCPSNAVTNNKVRGYTTAYDCVDEDGKNKTIPSPQD